ncbi:MAG TPA: hypothetical protein VF160_03050 [Candidatus Dormibacteraeota bacterium]
MRGTVTAARIVVRVTFLIQLVLGIALWTGRFDQVKPVHIASGVLLILGLWVLAAVGARSGVPLGLVILAFAWGALTVVFGLTQEQIFPDTGHWIVQILHLLVGIGAVAQAEGMSRRIRQGWSAPAPAPAPAQP